MLNEIYTGWRWPHVVDKIEHRPLDYAKIWRIAQSRTKKPIRFGTCCSQVMGLFLDIHTPKYKDKREVLWDMAEAMNTELLSLKNAGCQCIQIEEPCFHFMANTYGKDHDEVKFYLKCYNREVHGLEDIELWTHTCWGNPNMQRVIDNDSYAASLDMYLSEARGDVLTMETKDRGMREIELLGPYMKRTAKKICIGVVSHRRLQVEQPEEVADTIRLALKHVPPERLIISTDCGFGRQGCNRDIAFFKSVSIALGTNIVRKELGLPVTDVPAANPGLQTDLVPDKVG
jgi:5-methyltetrahydropteroyltriglutamate--homocysteine methyltransferase